MTKHLSRYRFLTIAVVNSPDALRGYLYVTSASRTAVHILSGSRGLGIGGCVSHLDTAGGEQVEEAQQM